MKIFKKVQITGAVLACSITFSYAQRPTIDGVALDGRQNAITSAVPFLMITPDTRAAGMADIGAATTPDANSIHWNSAKLAFMEDGKKMGLALSYTPWLKRLVPDVNLGYLSFYRRIDEYSTFGASFRYFSLGSITFTDQTGSSLGNFTPNEWSLDGAYSRKLSDNFSMGIAMRFIYSNLFGNAPIPGGPVTKAGIAGAGDLGFYYQNEGRMSGKKLNYAFGAAITNIGNKITYTTSVNRDFIPTNLRLGAAGTVEIDDYNTFTLTADVNKLLIPTPPIFDYDTLTGVPIYNPDGSRSVLYGKPSDVPVVSGMIQSFYDAPGGFKEEMKEINWAIGAEYWYTKQFAARAGFFHEPKTKGNRSYATIGAGVRYNAFGLDAAYLIPVSSRNHPLNNTWRFTLMLELGQKKKK